MGIIIRQSIKSVSVTYFGMLLGFINTLWLFPLVLSEQEIGLARTFINSAVLFSTFASFGASNIPIRFFPYFRNFEKEHYGLLGFVLLLGLIGFFIFCIVFFILKNVFFATYQHSAPLLLRYFYYFIPLTAAMIFWGILEAYTIVHQMPVVPSFLREVVVRAGITVALLFVYVKYFSIDNFILFIVFIYVLLVIVLLFYLRKHRILFLRTDFHFIRSNHLKEILIFAGFLFAGNLSGAIITNIDGLMISAYSSLKYTGIYSIAFFIGTIVEVPKRSLSQVLVPMVSEANKANDIPKLEFLYRKSSISQLIIGGIIFLLLWCNIESIFALIPHGEIYAAGKWVVFFIGLGKLFDMSTGINAEIIGTSRYYKIDLLFFIFLSGCGIILNIILIPWFNITGAAIALALSIILFNVMRFLFIYIKFKIHPFSSGTLQVLLLGIFIILINMVIPKIPIPLVDIALRSVLIIVLFIPPIIYLNISEEITTMMTKIVERVRHR